MKVEEHDVVRYMGRVYRVIRTRMSVDQRELCDLVDNKEFDSKYPLTVPTADVTRLDTEIEE